MGWLWFGLAIIVAGTAITVVLLSRIHFDVLFTREGTNDLLQVKVKALFGFVHYKYEIPVMYWAGIRDGLKTDKEIVDLNRAELKSKETKITRQKLIKRFEKLRTLLAHTFELHRWLIETMARVRCSDVSWNTKIGLGDAPDTAITSGLIWTVKSSLLGYAFRYVKLSEAPRLSVVPLFNEEWFETTFHCQLQIRLGVALLAGFHLLRRIKKSKGGFKVWRNTLTKA